MLDMSEQKYQIESYGRLTYNNSKVLPPICSF